MEHFNLLDEVNQNIVPFKTEILERLNKIDWECVRVQCLEDYTYTPIQAVDIIVNGISYREIKRNIITYLNTPHEKLRDYLWETDGKVRELYDIQIQRFKQEFNKLDPDLRPNLMCNVCGYFGISEEKLDTHICKKTVICKNCGKNCKTHERLQNHLEKQMCMKRYQCEKCKYQTNSDNSWKLHINSKEHKGVIKQSYHCELCNFTSEFPARFKEHCNTTKHKKRTTYSECVVRDSI